jgi:class 3 adenylate cyclase
MQRSAVTPGMARKLMDMTMQTNLRDVLPTIRVPTIVVHARGDRMVPVHRGREVAALIPGARFIERDGDDAYGWLDPTWLTDVEEFLTGRRSAPAPDRVLATVLFTDIVDSVTTLGLRVRTGLHTGECEMRDDDVAGIAVHIASRVMHEAVSGEVLASSTVKDLVVGSGLRFADRGDHVLRGVPDPWRLYALER